MKLLTQIWQLTLHDYLLTAIVEKDDPVPRRVCDSLIMCIITAVNEGLRNGGGIGDVLRKPDIKVNIKSTIRDLYKVNFCLERSVKTSIIVT